MSASSVSGLLSAISRARTARDARTDLDVLRALVAEQPLDDVQRAKLDEALERLSEKSAGFERRWSPAVGQAHVLLCGGVGPTVGRLTVRRLGPPYGMGGSALWDRATSEICGVFDVLAAALAELGHGVPEIGERGHRFGVRTPNAASVDGASLGVAAAAALVSLWQGVPPSPSVAATARVRPDGTLTTVHGLQDKLRALRARYPGVRQVIVATDQELGADMSEGIEILRLGTLKHALKAFGLNLSRVRGAALPRTAARQILASFEDTHVHDYSPVAWRRHAVRARVCASHPRLSPAERSQALGWAALFHLHAGDAGEAGTLIGSIDEAGVAAAAAAPRVWIRIIQATGAIDRPLDEPLVSALELAERALKEAESLEGADRERLLGRALGTLGRAHMHTGDPELAVEHLRAAYEHHRAHDPLEKARSANYLATALRRAGRHAEALETVEAALAACDSAPGEPEHAISRFYALYERARIHFEQERWDAAEADCRAVMARQPDGDATYPALGCVRYAAAIELRRGGSARELLERACRVAEGSGGALRQVAAAVLGEALETGPTLAPDLEARVVRLWGEGMGLGPRREALDRVVY